MGYRSSLTLVQTPLVHVADVVCAAPQGAPAKEELASTTQVILPRRGVFTVRIGADAVVADPLTAVVLPVGQEYRVSHPAPGGDHSTVLVFGSDAAAQAFGTERAIHGLLRSPSQLTARLLSASLRSSFVDELLAEEGALGLLERLATDLPKATAQPAQPIAALQRRRVDEVRELLASDPARPWRLHSVAAQVNCSPYHLARQFRRLTGETVWRYVTRLRLAHALERVLDGNAALSVIAADMGFAHHSHLTSSFRRTFGCTPSTLRTQLSSSDFTQLRKILTAETLDQP